MMFDVLDFMWEVVMISNEHIDLDILHLPNNCYFEL
jgi:hypothetical protein